uniref:Uncharacterized protein n=1 Tax=Megaselia scalaris TaxID=36166 RepID=T1GBW2_MEGSC
MSSQISSTSVIQSQDLSLSLSQQQPPNRPLQVHLHRQSPESPQPELATMTNVNVLDLQPTNDKDAVFIYESPKMINLHSTSDQHQHHVILDHMSSNSESSGAVDATNQPLAKIEFDDNQIIRVVGPNGEQQQIISREIINGEHHILSRNEAGEHILTRIVSDPSKLLPNENSVVLTAAMFEQSQKLAEQNFQTGPIEATILQQQYNSGSAVEMKSNDNSQIIFTSDKDHMDKIDSDIYATENSGGSENGKQIDLIYNDGNKTVIYTTSDQKGMEIYQGGDLSGLVTGDTPIVVQGGMQYTTAQSTGHSGGQALFIVAESALHAVDGHLHAR